MATTFRNKKNHPLGVGTLNTAIDDNDLSIVLDAGQGASFPSATFTISIDEEIILIDSRSTDTLTVNASGRGYDSSTASAHAAGVAIANYQIVKDFTDLETAVNTIESKIDGTNALALDGVFLKYGTDSDIKFGYDEATNDRGEWRDPSDNVLAYLKDLGTTGLFGVTGRIECPQIGISADTDLLALAANALTVNGTVTASSDTDSTHIFGRIRLHAVVSDFATFSHFDVSSSGGYALMHGATGNTYLNAVLGGSVSFRINNTAKGTLDGTKWDVAIPFTNSTITTFAANDTSPTVAAGNIFKVPATWTAGNNITTFDNGLTGQQITIIGGDSDCTVVDGSNLVMAGDWVAAPNATLTLIFDGTNWYERCRSAN